MSRQSRGKLSNFGAWYYVFRHCNPPKARPWVHIVTKNDSEFEGFIRYYQDQDNAPVRDIVLGGSSLRGKLKGEPSESELGAQWDAIYINADEIASIRVVYVENGQRRRRRTKVNPDGLVIEKRAQPVPETPAADATKAIIPNTPAKCRFRLGRQRQQDQR
jgi:hypothetical protein